MSDRMTPISFGELMKWIMSEKKKGSIFGLRRMYRAQPDKAMTIFGRKLETPIGPAAGPHTQLTQNIVAAYVAGSRFFELKTVQKIDGEDLPVNKPCILADDECYNCEWSTELTVPQAFDEYIKAWFILKVISKEFGLGATDGFQFNISVGYDLDGIKTKKVDDFINGMMNAAETPIYKECKVWLKENISLFKNVTEQDINDITPDICNSATISTLHGCPPDEIERIANYLIDEKGLNTFIKCNPTLLGYEYARSILDEMGYDYIQFTDLHFREDLQYSDAVLMLGRLMKKCEEKGLSFGVKITNTFPVDVKEGQLPSDEMYMSGKSLYPLSMSVASQLSKALGGKLRIAYSGGADAFNMRGIIDAGIWPVTVATTLLKPGGYPRLIQIAENIMEDGVKPFDGVDVAATEKLIENAKKDPHHVKPVKPLPVRKNNENVPLTNCFIAPCMETCPIRQDITTYGRLVNEGNYEEALRVITDKNPLPFITGTICPHGCQGACTRNFYETPVQIRANKLMAAENGYDKILKEIAAQKAKTPSANKKVLIVGAGPAGISAAFFLAREGVDVTVYDENEKPGGVIANIIPAFRISDESINKDIELAKAAGAKFVTGMKVGDVKDLKNKEKADAVILCVGAHKETPLDLSGAESMNAHEFLRESKKSGLNVSLPGKGETVVVIGGGNTAMDTARAAKKNKGVKDVYLVYRRTKRYMPADAEELELAIEDGVIFKDLLAPKSFDGSKLVCDVMKLSDPDASGRRGVVATGELEEVPADVIIAAIGEQVDGSFYDQNGIKTNEKGFPVVNPETNETSVKGIYAAGDGLAGASIAVKAIAGAKKACEAILGHYIGTDRDSQVADDEIIYDKKGILVEPAEGKADSRCLACDHICENCVEACPNRANISLKVPGMDMHQIIHMDPMCNECGNCNSFCPYATAPYKSKFTYFSSEKDMENSENPGFCYAADGSKNAKIRIAGVVKDYAMGSGQCDFGKDIAAIVDTVYKDYGYMLV